MLSFSFRGHQILQSRYDPRHSPPSIRILGTSEKYPGKTSRTATSDASLLKQVQQMFETRRQTVNFVNFLYLIICYISTLWIVGLLVWPTASSAATARPRARLKRCGFPKRTGMYTNTQFALLHSCNINRGLFRWSQFAITCHESLYATSGAMICRLYYYTGN